MALDIGYVSAVGAGALSFLSPCVLPLVPPYLCYMAGVSVDDFRGDTATAAKAGARAPLLAASLAFVLGFSTVFIALGAGASTIGRLLRVWQEPLAFAAGILIIVMGLNFLGLIRIPFLSREARFQASSPKSTRCKGTVTRSQAWLQSVGSKAIAPVLPDTVPSALV